MQDKDIPQEEEQKFEPASLGKALEIYIDNGKIHIVTALAKDSLLQVLSLAMFEATKKGGD